MGWVSYETNNDADGISAMNKFFQLRGDSTGKILPKDYEYYAKLLKRSGQDSLAIIYLQKTLAVDSSNKTRFIEDIGDLYLNQKKYIESAKYLEKAQQFRTGIDGRLQYRIANNYLAAAKLLQPADSLLKKEYYVKADSAFSKVCQSSPDKYVGYYSRARLANLSDPDGSKGIAKPYYEKTLAIALVDKPEENKSIILESYQYLCSQIGFSFMDALKAKDKDKQALLKTQIMEILNKMLALDPANNYALENMKSLNPPVKKTAPGAKK
jgi:tetratricopeptide (TPR) repeat protein